MPRRHAPPCFTHTLVLLAAVAFTACDTETVAPTVEADVPRSAAVVSGEGIYTPIDLGGGPQARSVAISGTGEILLANVDGTWASVWRDGVVTELVPPPGVQALWPLLLSDAGVAAGQLIISGSEQRAFTWRDGVFTDLGTLGGSSSRPSAINRAGQVVGGSTTGAGERHAFLWENGVMTDLGTLGGNSAASGINEAGQVVGASDVARGEQHAFLWENGVMTDLGTLGGDFVAAVDINEAGQVVGTSSLAGGEQHAFLWENGVMTDLGTLGGGSSGAVAINDTGLILGVSTTAVGELHVVVWENGVPTDLGFFGQAFALNERGQAVGDRFVSFEVGRYGFVWEDGVLLDLPSLGWSGGIPPTLEGKASSARGVNDAGQIVGWALTETGERRAALWIRLVPVEWIEGIGVDVGVLADGGALNGGQTRALLTRLNVATAMLNADKPQAAVAQLEAFIREVEAFVTSGVLTAAEGAPLIEAARTVLTSLGA